MKNTVESGKRGEDLVCSKLAERGMKVIDRNVRAKFAEIDIVATHEDTLCFVEVRTRADDTLGHPAETVTPTKQRKIRRAAEAYLVKKRITNTAVRFDVATIVWKDMRFEYFENAF